jgi:hypothetical protein
MNRLLFIVKEVFEITGQGYILLPGPDFPVPRIGSAGDAAVV